MFVKKIQWGTSVEVKKLPNKDPPNSETIKNIINFSTLYFNENPDIEIKDIPDNIIVKYNDDYNILELDIIIKRKFDLLKKKELGELKEKLDDEINKMKQAQTGIERKISMKKKLNYETKINEIENEINLKNYNQESQELLKKYKLIGVKNKTINFGSNIINNNYNDWYRQEIIAKYLEVARDYINLTIYRENDDCHYCAGCGQKLDLYVDESGIKNCKFCGTEKIYLNRNCYINDSDIQSSVSHNDYEDRKTFYKSILRFQGKQLNKIPKRLWNELDQYFENLGLLTGNSIKMIKNFPDGTKPGTSKTMMLKALQELGFVDCYEDINLICNIYWGWVLPDISHLEDLIMEQYDLTQRIFEKIKKGKQSSLNAEYRLFKHLELIDYPCKEDDFKIIKTRDTLENCEEKWKLMCENAGIKFIPTI